MKGIIDRFEGEYVVEVDGITKDFLKEGFPEDAKQGDVVIIEDSKITKLRKEIEDLMNEVWED